MSRIDELIQELCPDGVEFAQLQAVFTTKGGYTPSKNDPTAWADGTVPWFRMEDIRDNGRILGSSLQKINESAVKGGRLFPANSILVATSATIGEHALITVPHLSNQRFTSLTLKPEFVDRFEIKFVFYYCFVLDEWCRNNTTTSSFASVDMSGFKKFRFPVPPLEVQREIVRVLDKFTQLEIELEAELDARRTQYDYFFRNLLSFRAGEAKELTLGDIGRVAMCKRVFKSETSDSGDVPFFKIGTFGGTPDAYISRELFDSYREKFSFPRRGDVLISAAGTIGRTVVYDGEAAYFQDSNIVWLDHDESIVTNAYLRHWYKVIEWVTDGGTIRRLYNSNLLRARILVPPRAEQDRITKILDRFDALVNDIRIGLPAELDARRKQYEYYRDRLLTFKEAV